MILAAAGCSIIVEEVQSEKREQARPGRRCKARNARGEPCRATIVGPDGLCPTHGGRDMRELGRRGGKSRREPHPERVPQSLREELRSLDPAVVRGAIEQALSGSNESTRVAAVKLLADVDAFSREGAAERDFREAIKAEQEQHREEATRMLRKLVVDAVVSIVLGENLSTRPAWVSTLAENLDVAVKARIEEMRAEREALDAELASVKLQRQEFSAV
jgi:hypothetical protein